MIRSDLTKPLIVQSDMTMLLDVHNELFDDTRAAISSFSEIDKSPEHIHTYKISPLTLWNAASAGVGVDYILDTLNNFSRFPVPKNVSQYIKNTINKFGKVMLLRADDPNLLEVSFKDEFVKKEALSNKKINSYIKKIDEKFFINLLDRGFLKQALINIGYPVNDIAPLIEGEAIDIELRKRTLSGKDFFVRDYQEDAVKSFYVKDKLGMGYGTIVLPCGSGKTIVGIKAIEQLKCATLILTTNTAAVHQWQDELLDKTSLTKDEIGEYTGAKKNIKSVTVATYQILTWRKNKNSDFSHFSIFKDHGWGLIIYDEVHLLPAPIFRITAEIQAIKRLGLTATLIREDGKERDVFSLVGPKRYDVPWKELESKGWIADAYCHEIRVDLPKDVLLEYAIADKRSKYRIASENREKISIAKQLIENHSTDSILVIGQYIKQLDIIAKELNAPLITGKTPSQKREELYKKFRSGEVKLIIVSKVANFAIDLPDASVAIQISGTFGSRQEEAQRLGRILRPKKKRAVFYSIVSSNTTEETFAANRQKFLIEQGYKYHLEMWNDYER